MEETKKGVKILDKYLKEIEDMFGGDISFYPPISELKLSEIEIMLNYRLPDIFRWFYTQKTNGIKIDNKSILPIFDAKNKKTRVENVDRYNDPTKELYFKGKPYIFDDYVIIGYDYVNLICISKKYYFSNPLLYECSNPNTRGVVNFYRTDFNLENYLRHMVQKTFSDESSNDLVLK